ncbi:uncharacterized protein BDR25DRAFT_12864 [Lindgomyces ingoldianus]|uniref:Uncharacterized protein n=1 Tax=Lindgomyces ingoldianus TaxID=673940 RepID=A0ACB6R0Z8_9PLEO|nr:uncharacterized protein BDR25DRAFT_12864 [Lindgomyces ingoldianus]KAF2472959.1 hypothetical protein BDR25DRAFT_12864 [Lindgomyces ingoldianus]
MSRCSGHTRSWKSTTQDVLRSTRPSKSVGLVFNLQAGLIEREITCGSFFGTARHCMPLHATMEWPREKLPPRILLRWRV